MNGFSSTPEGRRLVMGLILEAVRGRKQILADFDCSTCDGRGRVGNGSLCPCADVIEDECPPTLRTGETPR